MSWKTDVFIGTAAAACSPIALLYVTPVWLAVALAIIWFLTAVVWLQKGWHKRAYPRMTYEEWLNHVLRENGQKPIEQRWNR